MKKFLSLISALMLTATVASASISFNASGRTITSMKVTLPEGASNAVAYCAVYNQGDILTHCESVAVSESGEADIEDFTVSEDETLRAFLWSADTLSPYEESLTYVFGDGIIHFKGTYIDAAGVNGVSVSGSTLTISEAGVYTIEGTSNEGRILVTLPTSSDEVTLNLASLDLCSAQSAPFYASCGKVKLNLTEGSTNAFYEEGAYTADEPNACVFSKNDLTIKGNGSLTVKAIVNNGIGTKKDLKLKGGTVNVEAPNNALKGNESVTIDGASVTLRASGDGIKSDCEDDEAKGYVKVSSGTLDITSGDDGIQAFRSVYFEGGTTIVNSTADGIKSDMTATFSDGDYSVNITALQDGIQAATGMLFYGGVFDITATEDGIVSDTSIEIDGSDLTVRATQDGIQADTLSVFDGKLDITSGGGVNKSWGSSDTVSRKSLKGTTDLTVRGGTIIASSSEDTLHSNSNLTVRGGTLTLSAGDDGIHADTTLTIGGTANILIKTSYEALESATITIEGGTIHATASDDAINAADGTSTEPGQGGGGPGGRPTPGGGGEGSGTCTLNITGGYTYLVAGGDGLDANGTINISGGTTIVNGPTSGGNGVLDYDRAFNMTGGTLIAAGTKDMAQSLGTASTASAFAVTFSSRQNAQSLFRIEDSSGNALVTYAPCVYYQYLIVATPAITRGGTYKIYTGGTCSGAQVDGLYTGGTYSGTLRKTVTATSASTSVSI